MIQVKDLQFPRYFLLHEINLDPKNVLQILQTKVEIHSGEPDQAIIKDDKIIITSPSSITKFLFLILYKLIIHYTKHGIQQDKLGLGLLFACKAYTHIDYVESHKKSTVLISGEKLSVCSVVIDELIVPLVGKISHLKILFLKNNFVDACEVIESTEKLSKKFELPFKSVSFHDYPIIMCNSSIYNEAAIMSHICIKTLEHNIGRDSTNKVIKNLILSNTSNIGANLLSVLKILKGDPIFVIDFVKYLKSNVTLNFQENKRANQVRDHLFASDKYLSQYTKVAQSKDGKHTTQVFKQWHEWAAIVGLIEKQLEPMRGSMWPTTDNVKPYEDDHRLMEMEESQKKGKNQLNFEELLDLTRSWYGHKAVQPGELTEKLLSEVRVWKT